MMTRCDHAASHLTSTGRLEAETAVWRAKVGTLRLAPHVHTPSHPFEGKAGAIQIRTGGIRLSLPRKGTLGLRGKSVAAQADSERTVSRSFP